MFKESVCPFAQKRNVEICNVSEGFDFEDLAKEVTRYEIQIKEGIRKRIAKCFILSDFENFAELKKNVSLFETSFKPFNPTYSTAVVNLPNGETYFWFLVSNLYPNTHFRHMPMNMVVLNYEGFFPSGDSVFYHTLNESVKRSLGYNPFPSGYPNNHRLCDLYPVIVENYRRLVLTAVHDESEPSYFNFLCGDLAGVLESELEG